MQGYSIEKERELFDEQIEDILANTRWYLDNLDCMAEYRVSWGNYKLLSKKRHSITVPIPKGL
jgi:hypothetical protein